MSIFLKRWRLALVAVLATIAVLIGFSGEAFAAVSGEDGSWHNETVNLDQHLALTGTVSEARNGPNGVNQLEAWRSATDDQVWFSLNNSTAFTIGTTHTDVSPAVVAWGPNNFMVFHTGTDGHIYWTSVGCNGVNQNGFCTLPIPKFGSWAQVPGQTTNMSVSVAQLGAGSSELYMTYRGSGSDQRVFGTHFNGGSWDNIQPMAGALSPSAPSIASSPQGSLFAVVRGDDNQVYMIPSFNDGLSWQPAIAEGGVTFDSPRIAISGQTANMLVAHRGTDDKIYYETFNFVGQPTGGWSPDITGWQTHNPIELTAIGGTDIYAVVTGLDGHAYFKRVYTS